MVFKGEGGGLGVTEPETSGAAIAREMQSYYEYTDGQTIYVNAAKYWQGNSQSDFLLVAAKERKTANSPKSSTCCSSPKHTSAAKPSHPKRLRAVRYAVNRIDAEMPATAVMKLSQSDAAGLRAFQNIFIRSRLQLIGMTHGIMEYILKTWNDTSATTSDSSITNAAKSGAAIRFPRFFTATSAIPFRLLHPSPIS